MILKKGSKGDDVKKLQQALIKEGYILYVDGVFGSATETLVKNFQNRKGLTADGIAGPKTLALLGIVEETTETTVTTTSTKTTTIKGNKKLTETDYQAAAKLLNVPVACVKAVTKVESGGSGFYTDGKPVILFEGHIFWSELKKLGLDPNKYVSGNEDILYSKWTKSHYLGGEKEYTRLEKATKINKNAAYASASWGLFQIMGNNYKACGCSNVTEMVDKMYESEYAQLKLFCSFIKSNKLDTLLRNKDWAGFAKKYNGAGYAKNKYDTKLKAAYEQFSK